MYFLIQNVEHIFFAATILKYHGVVYLVLVKSHLPMQVKKYTFNTKSSLYKYI